MREQLRAAIEPVATAREAVRGADIVATCTDSMDPVIEGGWLEAGMHVVNIGPPTSVPTASRASTSSCGRASTRCPCPKTRCSAKAWATAAALSSAAAPKSRSVCRSRRPEGPPVGPLYAEVISGKAPGRTAATRSASTGRWATGACNSPRSARWSIAAPRNTAGPQAAHRMVPAGHQELRQRPLTSADF